MPKIEDEFISIHDKYSDAIFRYCYFRIYDREIAKELTQEAFLRAWKYIADDKKVDNLRALLYQISRNLIYDHREKNKLSVLSIDEHEMTIKDNTDHAEQVDNKIEAEKLIAKIKQLDEQYQEVLIMRFVEGLKPKEISEILDESTNVISVRITRGKKELRKIL